MQVTNLEYLADFCQQDKAKMEKYIRLYIQKADQFIQDLSDQTNAERQADLVHGLKASITLMGMRETKDLSVQAEDALRSGAAPENIATMISSLTDQVRTSIDELEAYIAGQAG